MMFLTRLHPFQVDIMQAIVMHAVQMLQPASVVRTSTGASTRYESTLTKMTLLALSIYFTFARQIS